MPAPFLESALNIDLSPRVGISTAVVGSPAAAAETIVCSASLPADLQFASGVLLVAFAAFTVGTNGVSANLQIRQTNVTGTVKAATGLVTQTAANLSELLAVGFDTGPSAGQIYKATLIVTSGSAASTVSNVALLALAVQVNVPGVIYPPAHSSERIDPTSIPGYYVPEQVPLNSTSTVYEKSHLASSGAARFFGVAGYNSGAAQFILVFDLGGSVVPTNGSVPALILPVAATSVFSLYYGSVGRWFNAGIVLCNSSTGPTLTIGSADCWFDVQYIQTVPIVSGQITPSVGSVTNATVATNAALATSKLAGYPTDATKTLAGDGTWPTLVAASQTPITDLNLGVLTLLTDVITAIGTMQAKVNTLLAELRTARLLSP